MSAPPTPPAPHARRHLTAALGALIVLAAAWLAFTWWGERSERKAFSALLPLFAEPLEHAENDRSSIGYIEHLKNQGLALQQRGFERSDLLPLYGSSELVHPIPDKAGIFFRHFPTGFSVFPVGKAGTTPLIMMQKLASLGEVTRGRRIAIAVSPAWFFPATNPDHAYAGNFSRQQAFAALVNPALSFELKHNLAQRLLMHPGTIQKEAILYFMITHLARGGPADHAEYAVVWPLARLNQAIYAAQDHFENIQFIRHYAKALGHPPAVVPAQFDWDRLIAGASAKAPRGLENPLDQIVRTNALVDQAYRKSIRDAPEWHNLELLMAGLHEMNMRPLVLCIPPNGVYLKHIGVTQETLLLFSAHIREIATRYGAQVEMFEDHIDDDRFCIDHRDHLSVKGWMYFNRAIDQFYRGEELKRGDAPQHSRPHTAARHSVRASGSA